MEKCYAHLEIDLIATCIWDVMDGKDGNEIITDATPDN